MKFSCPLICGLILSCICFRGSYEEFSVIQSPSTITVNEGESAQISCCWNTTTEGNNVVKVSWLKNGMRIPKEKRIYKTVPIKNCSVLNITSIVKNDTGDYVCKVFKDIPFLIEKEGIKTVLNVSDREHITETTTQDNVPVPVSSPAGKGNPDGFDHSKISPEDENYNNLDPGIKGSSTSHDAVMIYILRSLPFVCLLMAFFYLNRDNKQARVSKPVERAGEDPEAGEPQRNETEVPEREKGMDNTGKPEVTVAATEEEKNEEKETVVAVDIKKGSSPIHENESKSISLDTTERTNLMTEAEGETVSVL
ncbi:uncharacterized protein [Pseudorasbora parva]|uniref:uncharacterized protein n=1 Tax=Pseudorasbora parva TaxID=51549 RepID=UPI00351DB082